jgi:hypothetical protein
LKNELSYNGKPVFILGHVPGRSKLYEVDGCTFEGYIAESFQPSDKIKIDFTLPEKELHAGDTLNIQFMVSNPNPFDIYFHHPEFPLSFRCAYKVRKYEVFVCDGIIFDDIDILKSGGSITNTFKTVVPNLPTGKYLFGLTLDNTVVTSKNCDYVPINLLNQTE